MEDQNIEYKQSWRDEYIKWICGFANAAGGKIYIGIDDTGNVLGIPDTKKLLEEIPNKTKDILGILVDVNIKTKASKKYLEIIVEAYPYPVSYKGQYHYRSGSTKQELKGAALDKFILQKQGKKWDGVPQPNVTVKNLSKNAFDIFKKLAKDTKRINQELLKDSPAILLEKLYLTTDTGHLKKAAILLFYDDPEKYVTGAYIKIGFFNSDDDLAYQDEMHGNLFEQVEKTMELLLTKYLRATIAYKKIQRIEEYPIPEPALREALLNAVVHKDYSSGNPIQISVYNDKIIFWNEGELPDNWTVEKLKIKHPSRPFNPDIANTFFRAGLIEAWGRGTIKILNECKKANIPIPVFKYDLSGFIIEFKYVNKETSKVVSLIPKNTANKIIHLIMENPTITIEEISSKVKMSQITIKRNLKMLQTQKVLERIGGKKTGSWSINLDKMIL